MYSVFVQQIIYCLLLVEDVRFLLHVSYSFISYCTACLLGAGSSSSSSSIPFSFPSISLLSLIPIPHLYVSVLRYCVLSFSYSSLMICSKLSGFTFVTSNCCTTFSASWLRCFTIRCHEVEHPLFTNWETTNQLHDGHQRASRK